MTARLWLFPALLLYVAPLCSAGNLSGNQELGTVSNENYRAIVNNNGTFRFEPVNGPALKVAFIQRWVKYQRADQISLMQVEIVESLDKETVSFVFSYFWNDGEVEERLNLHPLGFNVSYFYRPFGDKNVETFSILIEHGIKNAGDYDLTALRYYYDLPGALEHDIPWTEDRKRYSQVSLRKKGGLTTDFSMEYNSWLWLWRDMFGTANCGPDWSKKKYRSGETYRTGFNCFISGSDGRSIALSPLVFTRHPKR